MKPPDDPRLLPLLEACYSDVCAGLEPDLDRICAAAPELRSRIAELLRREREHLGDLAAAGQQQVDVPPRIGDFVVLEPIGLGGMSQVFRARQEPMGREVALKVLRTDVTGGAASRLRFQREATIAGALNHPHIVPLYAAGEEGGRLYLAMRLLRGFALDRLPATDPETIARIGLGVARALQAAHDVGVVHRDVKPANILVEAGTAYLMDFGLAVFAHHAGAITRPDTTPGTLAYLPPETVTRRGNTLDPRVDVYGLGASLYEALAGRPPFESENSVRTLHQIVHRDPPALGLRGRGRDLETIVARAMDKSPQRRFPTARDFADELERYLDGAPIRSRPCGVLRRGWRLARRYPGASASLALVLVLAAILTLTIESGRRSLRARVQSASAAAQRAIDRGDLLASRRELATLQAIAAGSGDARRFERECDCLARVQQLTAVLQSPTVHLDARILDDLAAQVAKSTTAVALGPAADAALAITSRLRSEDPLQHRPLAAATVVAWPRTAAALSAWAKGGDVAGRLAALGDISGGSGDHLFAALALRLAQCPESVVERELRREVDLSAGDEGLRFSIAIALETQEQYVAAYDWLLPLAAHPIYGVLASAGCARLASAVGRGAEALKHLAAVRRAVDDPLMQRLSLLSELQVLDDLGRRAEFWERWEASREVLDHLPQFWLRGGYAAARELDDPGMVERARDCFASGLVCVTDSRRRFAIEVAGLQLEWAVSPATQEIGPLPDDAANAAERARLAGLAAAAADCAARGIACQGNRTMIADALLVAAEAELAGGDRARGWQHLERACREFSLREARAAFAWHTGLRELALDHGAADPDEAAAASLDEAAVRALTYLEDAEAFGSLDDRAWIGLFLCAYHVGRAAEILRAAIELESRGLAPLVEPMCDEMMQSGGVRFDRIRSSPERVAPTLRAAAQAVDSAVVAGRLTSARAVEAVGRWRELAARVAAPGDDSLRRELGLLQERLSKPGKR